MRYIDRNLMRDHVIPAARAQCWAQMADHDLQFATREALRLDTAFAKRRFVSRYSRFLSFTCPNDRPDVDAHVDEMFDSVQRSPFGKRGGAA